MNIRESWGTWLRAVRIAAPASNAIGIETDVQMKAAIAKRCTKTACTF